MKTDIPYFILISFFTVLPCIAGDKLTVDLVNKKVDSLETELKNGSFEKTTLATETQAEVSPPTITFLHSDGKLVSAVITMNHEGWQNRFQYWFDNREKPLKYLKTSTRPDEKNKRQAVIYQADGTVLWKNADLPELTPDKILAEFKAAWDMAIGFSKY